MEIENPEIENEAEIKEEIETENEGELEVEGEIETPEVPDEEYTPNLTYKFKDEEFEFDEKVKGFIKSKEDEEYFRDLYTSQKAHSAYKELGSVRELEETFQKVSEFEDLNQEIDKLSGLLSLNSSAGFEEFRNHLGISKDQIMKWAVEEAQLSKDPNLQGQIMQQRQMEAQNFNLQYHNNMMQNKMETEIVQQRTAELDALSNQSEVSKAYDSLVGTPGSFRQAVIDYGLRTYHSTGREIGVEEALRAVENQFQGLVANQSSGTSNQVVKQDPKNTVVIRQESKGQIPNVGGGSQSPAKKKVTSLEGLRKLSKTMD
jgi:hypothetical protein